MSIITLTTDLGYRDPYLGIVKAQLYSHIPSAKIVDLSCAVRENNISHAAFIIKNSLPHFPLNTIHLVAVKFIADHSGLNKSSHIDNTRFLITYYKNQFIVSPDTGLFTLLDKDFNEPVYQIYYEGKHESHFFLKDIFVQVAAELFQGKKPEELGMQTKDFHKAFVIESYLDGKTLRGRGIYADDFGNIICNVSKERFEEAAAGRKFRVILPGLQISEIQSTYDDVLYGTPLVLFNSFGYLEVAINGKNAFKMLSPRDAGAHLDFNLIIEFDD